MSSKEIVWPSNRQIGKLTNMVMEQREEIIKAFIAKYNCSPDEIEQVIQTEDNKVVWYLRKKITLKVRNE